MSIDPDYILQYFDDQAVFIYDRHTKHLHLDKGSKSHVCLIECDSQRYGFTAVKPKTDRPTRSSAVLTYHEELYNLRVQLEESGRYVFGRVGYQNGERYVSCWGYPNAELLDEIETLLGRSNKVACQKYAPISHLLPGSYKKEFAKLLG